MKIKSALATALVACAMSSPTWALTINGGATDVGMKDSIVASDTLANSGDATELAWVNSIVDPDVTMNYKLNFADWSGWNLVDGETDVYAFDLTDNPEYFLIKLGLGNLNGETHYLYQNNSKFGFAVVDLSDWGLSCATTHGCNLDQINIGKVSHLDSFGEGGSDDQDVPAPAPLALLGLGLVGMALTRRKA